MNKQSLKETDVYILAMAFVDIFACMVVCPQYPFMEKYIDEYMKHKHFALKQLLTCTGMILYMNLGLLAAIALNRVLAVFRPFTFGSSPKRSKRIVFVIVFTSLFEAIVFGNMRPFVPNADLMVNILTALHILLCLIVLTVSYPLIAIKLHRQGRKVNRPNDATETTQEAGTSAERKPKRIRENEVNKCKTSLQSNQTAFSITAGNCNSVAPQVARKTTDAAKKIDSKGGKTLKIFFVLTLLFLLSFIPLMCLITGLTNYLYVAYTAFISSDINFVVYLCFREDFRKDVHGIWKRIKSCF